uniref:Uncharacterized protein n=1 Tax=Anguilla anguilla TaxID=7936 RepID=A0A0E9TP16_ANGAN
MTESQEQLQCTTLQGVPPITIQVSIFKTYPLEVNTYFLRG